MVSFGSKHAGLLLYAGSTLAKGGFLNFFTAPFGLVRITSNATYEAEDFKKQFLSVKGKDTTLEFKNSQYVFVEYHVWNQGRMIMNTDAAALKDHRHGVNYDMLGFYNEGLFAVRHEKADLPISVVIYGVELPHFFDFGVWNSENLGTMIFLSNCEAAEGNANAEVEIRMQHQFVNLGTMSVLGTKKQEAHLQMQEIEGGSLFVNTGIIYLKHAVLEQKANLAGEGCIIIGEKSWINTQAQYTAGMQRLHFADGSAGLMIDESDDARDRIHYITNFPRGSFLRLKNKLETWRVEESDFFVTDIRGRESITIRFVGYTLDETKVIIDSNQMTYAEDLVREAPDFHCAGLDLVLAEASKYEIEA